MHFYRLASGAFGPEDVAVVQRVFDRISSEVWFSDEAFDRAELARYVLQMYARGLVMPEKLEAVCRAAAKRHSPTATPSLAGRRILVVEDDYYAATETAEELEALGAIVVGPISSLSEAMDVASDDLELDGALLDVNLNGEMVYPVAGFLKMHGIPFAFLSGYEERVLPPAFRSSKMFEKPANWAVLASQVPVRTKSASA